jgi:hypothetical protein
MNMLEIVVSSKSVFDVVPLPVLLNGSHYFSTRLNNKLADVFATL